MKIIFDSEHQKYTFMKVLAGKSGCPPVYGLNNIFDNPELLKAGV